MTVSISERRNCAISPISTSQWPARCWRASFDVRSCGNELGEPLVSDGELAQQARLGRALRALKDKHAVGLAARFEDARHGRDEEGPRHRLDVGRGVGPLVQSVAVTDSAAEFDQEPRQARLAVPVERLKVVAQRMKRARARLELDDVADEISPPTRLNPRPLKCSASAVSSASVQVRASRRFDALRFGRGIGRCRTIC